MRSAQPGRVARRASLGIALALGLIGACALIAYAATPQYFAGVFQPVGVAATTERVLVTHPGCISAEHPEEILQIDPAGNVSTFALLPPRDMICAESYLAVAPGMGGWAPGWVYVAQGGKIFKIPPDGSMVSLFAEIPSIGTTHNDMTFDTVGTFGHDLIVTGGAVGGNGEVWRVSATGTTMLVASVTEPIEGPDVAPMSFGPLGGQIFAAHNDGIVYAIATDGTVTPVVTWPSCERVHFVPENLGSLGNTGLSFFGAQWGTDSIIAYPATDFAGVAGEAIVTSEYDGHVGMLSWNGSSYVIAPFFDVPAVWEGSDFVEPVGTLIVPVDIHPTSCPNPINTNSNGVTPVAILGTATFDVRTIDPATVRLEGVAPVRHAYEDVATPFVPFTGRTDCREDCWTRGPDGMLDLTLKFETQQFVAALGSLSDGQCLVAHVTGMTYDGKAFQGEDVIVIRKKK